MKIDECRQAWGLQRMDELRADLRFTFRTLRRGRTTGGIIREEQRAGVRTWIENYHKLKDHLEKISEINRELLRRDRQQKRKG